jgi:hypothetical protein
VTSHSASGIRPRPPRRRLRPDGWAVCIGGRRRPSGRYSGSRGLRTIEDLQSLLETAAIETLALENSIARNRAIAGYAAVGAKLIEVGDHEERIHALEAAQQGRAADETDAFADVGP